MAALHLGSLGKTRQFKIAGTLPAPLAASCRLVPAGSESYATSTAAFRVKPRATTPGPIQPGEVELTTQMDRAGSMSQNKIQQMRSLLMPQLGRTAPGAGPRLIQLLS